MFNKTLLISSIVLICVIFTAVFFTLNSPIGPTLKKENESTDGISGHQKFNNTHYINNDTVKEDITSPQDDEMNVDSSINLPLESVDENNEEHENEKPDTPSMKDSEVILSMLEFQQLSDSDLQEIESFLKNIIPKMPINNSITDHFSNALYILEEFKKLSSKDNEKTDIDNIQYSDNLKEINHEMRTQMKNVAEAVKILKTGAVQDALKEVLGAPKE